MYKVDGRDGADARVREGGLVAIAIEAVVDVSSMGRVAAAGTIAVVAH